MEFIDYDSDVVLLMSSLLSTVSLEGLPMVVEIVSEYLLVWSSIRQRVKVAGVNDSASEFDSEAEYFRSWHPWEQTTLT